MNATEIFQQAAFIVGDILRPPSLKSSVDNAVPEEYKSYKIIVHTHQIEIGAQIVIKPDLLEATYTPQELAQMFIEQIVHQIIEVKYP